MNFNLSLAIAAQKGFLKGQRPNNSDSKEFTQKSSPPCLLSTIAPYLIVSKRVMVTLNNIPGLDNAVMDFPLDWHISLHLLSRRKEL